VNQSHRAQEEDKLFRELAGDYNRHVSPSAPKGYRNFCAKWNSIAGERLHRAMLGEQNVVVIFRKSVAQLQEYFDYLEEVKRAASGTGEADEEARILMHQQLRSSRTEVTEPALERVGPLQYSQALYQTVPLGNPSALNPGIVGGTVQGRLQTAGNCAPFLVCPVPTLTGAHPAQLPVLPAAPEQDGRSVCKRCGFGKRGHKYNEYGLGKCTINICAHCGKSFHQHWDEVEHQGTRIDTSKKSIMGLSSIFRN